MRGDDVAQMRSVQNGPIVDEQHHVLADMALVVENVAAQSGIDGKRGSERLAQRAAWDLHGPHIDMTSQIRRQEQPRHADKLEVSQRLANEKRDVADQAKSRLFLAKRVRGC